MALSTGMDQVFTKILIDFINEHEEIGYDILSELNKFDQYIMGQRQPTLPTQCIFENAVNIQKLPECMNNNDKLLMDYAVIACNDMSQPVYNCKLCPDINTVREFQTIDQFLRHLQQCHASCIIEEQEQLELDKKDVQLWIGELEKIKKHDYQKHSDEFMKEIDEILGVEEFDMNAILNSLDVHNNSSIVFHGTDNIPDLIHALPQDDTASTSTSSTLSQCDSYNQEIVIKKKKKRTSGQCDICNRTFNDLYNLRIHKMIHTGEKPFQCEECGKRFRQYNKLKIHCITHTNEKPYICDICEKGFRFRNYLSVHKRLHSGENPYKCKFCDEYFHSLHSRRLHTKMLHCEAKTYSCSICDKVLTAQCYLTAHMKRHTNQRDYKCETCGKCFFSQSQLKDHQLVHTNLKPFQCNVCNARFQRKSNYTQHLKIHTGEKTYVCHICSKSFAQNAGLYGHMKSHAKC